jgi:hypothetical protein
MALKLLEIPESPYTREDIAQALRSGIINGMIVDVCRVRPGDRVKVAVSGRLATGSKRVQIKASRLGPAPQVVSVTPVTERFAGLVIECCFYEMEENSIIIETLHAGHQQCCRITVCTRESLQLMPPNQGNHACSRINPAA